MFKLIDTLNDYTISAHRSLDAAVKADKAHSRAVKRANGENSYIPTKIVEIINGEENEVDYYDLIRAENNLTTR